MRGWSAPSPRPPGMGHRSATTAAQLTGRGRRRARHLTRHVPGGLTRSTRQKALARHRGPAQPEAGQAGPLHPPWRLRWTSPRRRAPIGTEGQPDAGGDSGRANHRPRGARRHRPRRRGPQPPPSFPCHIGKGSERRVARHHAAARLRFQWTEAGAIGPGLPRTVPDTAQRATQAAPADHSLPSGHTQDAIRQPRDGHPRTHPARPGIDPEGPPSAATQTRCHRALPSRCLRRIATGPGQTPGSTEVPRGSVEGTDRPGPLMSGEGGMPPQRIGPENTQSPPRITQATPPATPALRADIAVATSLAPENRHHGGGPSPRLRPVANSRCRPKAARRVRPPSPAQAPRRRSRSPSISRQASPGRSATWAAARWNSPSTRRSLAGCG